MDLDAFARQQFLVAFAKKGERTSLHARGHNNGSRRDRQETITYPKNNNYDRQDGYSSEQQSFGGHFPDFCTAHWLSFVWTRLNAVFRHPEQQLLIRGLVSEQQQAFQLLETVRHFLHPEQSCNKESQFAPANIFRLLLAG